MENLLRYLYSLVRISLPHLALDVRSVLWIFIQRHEIVHLLFSWGAILFSSVGANSSPLTVCYVVTQWHTCTHALTSQLRSSLDSSAVNSAAEHTVANEQRCTNVNLTLDALLISHLLQDLLHATPSKLLCFVKIICLRIFEIDAFLFITAWCDINNLIATGVSCSCLFIGQPVLLNFLLTRLVVLPRKMNTFSFVFSNYLCIDRCTCCLALNIIIYSFSYLFFFCCFLIKWCEVHSVLSSYELIIYNYLLMCCYIPLWC